MRSRDKSTSLVIVLGLAWILGLAFALGAGSAPAASSASTPSPTPPVHRLFHHHFFKSYLGNASVLYLQNTGSGSANALLTFEARDGSGVYEVSETVPPKGTLELPAEGISELPSGAHYRLIVSSDQPLASVVQVHRAETSGDALASYRGVSSGQTVLHFGPFHKSWAPVSHDVSSSIEVWNVGDGAASATASIFAPSGVLVATLNEGLPSGQIWSIVSMAQAELPEGFRGWVTVTADQPMVGWLHQFSSPGGEFQFYGPLETWTVPGSHAATLPSVFKEVDEGNGPRTTNVFVGNGGSAEASATLTYSGGDGTESYSSVFSVPPSGATVVDLAEESILPSNSIWSATAVGDQQLLLGEVYYGESANATVGSYGSDMADRLNLPRILHAPGGHTVFSVKNLGASEGGVSISFYDLTGARVHQEVSTLPPGGWTRYDQRTMPGIPKGFVGSVVVDSSVPVVAKVDEYVYPPCEPLADVEIARTPGGDLFTGSTVRFTTSATGTKPFSYTWTLDELTVGEDRDAFEHTFSTPGTYTVAVSVKNGCGESSDAMVVNVQQRAADQPDLSESYKGASLKNVEAGDHLTYTILIRNTDAMTASATFTDPIPVHTNYIPGSARSSEGGTVTLADGAVHWAGQVISGTPVILSFGVEVGSPPVGTVITNAARLNDGLGNVLRLEAETLFNPGYRLSIDDGALFTQVPTVTLSLSWAAEDPAIEKMQISNDGGFGTGTDWIDVGATYSKWVLDTYGSLRLPRTVYALFRDGEGKQYGPIQDDIVYDPDPPQVTRVEIITQTTAPASVTGGARDVIVRVTTSDGNSGVGKAQVSDSEGFETYAEFAVAGTTTDIPWTLQPSGLVYVRVVDRADNVSQAASERGPASYEVYLPIALRQ